MKTYKTLIILALFSFLTTSCEDFFDMAIELDIEEHEPKLAITSFVSNTNNPEVLVSYSIGGLKEATDDQLLNNANVVLSQGSISYELSLTENEGIYKFDTAIDFIPNQEYTLTVESAIYPSVSSTQIFPQEVPILEATMNTSTERIQIRFKDNPNPENYYILSIEAFHPDYEIYSSIYMDEESSFSWSSSQNGILISDETFNGDEITINPKYSMRIKDDWENVPEPTQVNMILYSITEDVYRYDVSLRNNYVDPFTEPVILHRNIENGYGIFGMMNAYVFEIDLSK